VTSHTSIRTKTWKKDTQRHALTDSYVLDSAIDAPRINFVDEHGRYSANVPIEDALFEVNRATHYLVQVTPGKVDEFGRPDPQDLPTCRVISKMDLREQHKRKLDTLQRQAKGGPAVKNLELNWAIASGDLKHRLARLTEFMTEGRKVEVLLAPRNKGRKATEQEASDLMKAVRDAVGECKGATEVKSEGTVGGVMTIVFEGPKIKKKKEVHDKKKEVQDEKKEVQDEKKEVQEVGSTE